MPKKIEQYSSDSDGDYVFHPEDKDAEDEKTQDHQTQYNASGINDLVEKHEIKSVIPIQVAFKDLDFFVEVKKKRKISELVRRKENKEVNEEKGEEKEWKQILKGITGIVNPGEVLAIMGSSGAGKTTLLNVLAGRGIGKTNGEVLFNGNHREENKKWIKQQQVYVMQDDIMLKTQTPKEIITFSAMLRISNSKTKEEKIQRVQEIIEEMNIQNCMNTQVGAPGIKRGISGGERKRVAIGTELVTNPSLLFVDEPTSGLDSFTAENVMQSLHNLAHNGRTVICTIHQPNSDVFQLFDKLMLLAKGQVVYFGDSQSAVEYFSKINYPCPKYVNPPDHYIKLIHIDQSSEESEERVMKLIDKYNESDLYKKNQIQEIKQIPIPKEKVKHHGYVQGSLTQIKYLLKRNFSDILREPLKTRAHVGQVLFLGIILGLIFYNVGNTQREIQNRLGALFFVLVNQSFESVLAIVNTFPAEKSVFFREHSNNMYRTISFYFSKVVADLPFQIIFPCVFGTIVYWMVGFQSDAEKFFIFLTVVILCANIGSGLGFVLGTLARDTSVAISLVPLTVLPFMVFSGFFVNSNSVPDYFIWIQYISFINYGFQALTINEFQGLTFQCKEDEKLSNGGCPITTGQQLIESYGFDKEPGSIWANLLILLGMYIFWRILSYFALLYRVSKNTQNN